MLLLIVLQLLSTLFAIAPVVAQESAGDGTVPHVYDPGFSKNFADMDVPDFYPKSLLDIPLDSTAFDPKADFLTAHRQFAGYRPFAILDTLILALLLRMRVVQQVIRFAAFHRPPSAVARVHSASVYGLAAGPHKPLVEKDVVMPDILVAAVVVVILGTRALQESQYQLRVGSLRCFRLVFIRSVVPIRSVGLVGSIFFVGPICPGVFGRSIILSSPPAVTPTSTTSSMNGGTIAGATATAAPEPQAKNNTGAIVGGVVGGIAAICLLIGFIAVLLYKQRKQSSGTSEVASTYRAQVNSPGIPGSPGSVPSGYGYPNTSAPIPALVYNQNELYPNHLHEKNT
ncbi:hypothetical protein PIIN_08520 [Serendipita indica DSM 11827]|uniref:Uncharacterized protein n=1 Tax=Serendipita indica (strain DSM 11827) TaxID=1109443 RepID=G4TTC5_SERID|nr:hypothetical protein PIIN_08520 [Serendipita indica DSM 11827]